MMISLSKKLSLLLVSLSLIGCTTNDYTKHRVAEALAKENNFQKKLVRGGQFWFTTFQRVSSDKLPYVIYIEGDGEAFKKRYAISNDPTPRTPMMLGLAAQDDSPNVVYLARPCQYTPMEVNAACNQTYWTDKRMSEDSVHSMNEAVKAIAGKEPVDLIGFSGGGGMAVLIAARNPQIRSVTTVAGNLDHIAFNKFHRVRPMVGSLNPIDYAKKINHIPQLHLSGGKDKIVPAFIADDFVKASGDTRCIQREIISNATHIKNWGKDWKYILAIPLKCK